MFRRLWYWLREVVWLAVIAVALAVVGIVLTAMGLWHLGIAVVGAGIIFSLLSIRS